MFVVVWREAEDLSGTVPQPHGDGASGRRVDDARRLPR